MKLFYHSLLVLSKTKDCANHENIDVQLISGSLY